MDAASISLPLTANPQDLGDFLTGLLRLAKNALQRHPDLVRQIGKLVDEFSGEQFLTALPPLRLAFLGFSLGARKTLSPRRCLAKAARSHSWFPLGWPRWCWHVNNACFRNWNATE